MTPEMLPGRRLRLDRRKAGLSQEQLAALLGTTKDTVSEMERNVVELSTEAQRFIANRPSRAPEVAAPAEPEPLPPVEEQKEGPGPAARGVDDAPPRPGPKPLPPASKGEIEELEEGLLHFFAGQRFLVPRDDGGQREALIPGLAQMVGMVDEFDGAILEVYAPGMARAWAELARTNATVRKVLIGITYGGAYRGVVAASLPPLMAIMAHHGLVPGLGAVEPQTEPQERPIFEEPVP